MSIKIGDLMLPDGMTVGEAVTLCNKHMSGCRDSDGNVCPRDNGDCHFDDIDLMDIEVQIPENLFKLITPNTLKSQYKKIYICSPLRGDIEKNKAAAKDYCRWAALEYYPHGNEKIMPIAPHVYLTEFLNDNISEQRELGLEIGLDLLRECSEVWVFGNTISEGMAREIETAAELGIKIRFMCVFNDAAAETGGDENGDHI